MTDNKDLSARFMIPDYGGNAPRGRSADIDIFTTRRSRFALLT